jgi:hypothetical protein
LRTAPLPLIILGGRDRGATELPSRGRDKHILLGYKAVDLRIQGRPLISLLVERLRACGGFDPVYVAGPSRVYRPVCPDLEIVETDGSFGENIRAAIEVIQEKNPRARIAFTTCDILPKVNELKSLLEDFHQHRPLDFWMPQIRVPDDPAELGESQWKPRYRLVPEGETKAVETLPGHLVIVDPRALRLELIYKIFQLSYRTRNRSVAYRRAAIGRRVMGTLLAADLKRLATLRMPEITWDVARSGLAIAHGLRSGTMSAATLARRVGRAYVTRRHRRHYPERQGRMPVLEGLSLAKDIDTEEEARELELILSKEATEP